MREIGLLALGALAMAISFVEIVGHLFGSLQTLRRLTGRVMGRGGSEHTDMHQAMFWVRVLGLLLFGGLVIASGFSVQGA